ncbi:MAG: trypsin-like peptidase domain-containing protein [Phycisphaerales bacterium]
MRRFVAYGPAIVVLITCAVALLVAPAVFLRLADAQTTAEIRLARQTIDDDDILERIDHAVAAVADSVRPSVVHITPPAGARGFPISGVSGAGWVYDDQGHIVTNAHVVRGVGERFAIEFADGRIAGARLVAADPYTDVAVLTVNASGALFPLRRASPGNPPRQGERVFAFGSPFGFKFSMSEGIVSALGRAPAGVSTTLAGYTNYIQTDAAVNPGNSGGPLVNVRGEVIGMNVAIATGRETDGASAESGDSAGISFAIPVAAVEFVADQIIASGQVARGYLGVSFSTNGIERFGTGDNFVRGLLVGGVVEGGPAASAGLRAGDVITEVSGQPITDSEILSAIVSVSAPGAQIPMSVYSPEDGLARSVSVTLGQMPDLVLAQRVAPALQTQLGALIGTRRRDLDAAPAYITRVVQDSLAADIGLTEGMRITAVNGTPVDTLEDFYVEIVHANTMLGRRTTFSVEGPEDTDKPRDISFRLTR